MRFTIFYFSATGNSLQIARTSANSLEDCTIKPMASGIPQNQVGGANEAIGFVFPVFYSGLPRLVKQFITDMTLLPNTYCFTLINSGGSPANPAGMLSDILAKKNLCLSYAAEIVMPTNYIIGHQTPPYETAQRMINTAVDEVIKSTKEIAACMKKPIHRKYATWSKMINTKFLYKGTATWDEVFISNRNCNGCGICSKVCPVGNIEIICQRPVWNHACEHCLACLHWCPNEAIDYSKKTVGRQRYRNPSVEVTDIFAK